MTLKIATFQLNATLGDLAGNAQKIVAAARAAHARGVDLVLTPELSISGAPALDLLLQPDFVADCETGVHGIAAETADLQGLTLVVGHPAAPRPGRAGRVCSGFSVVRHGEVIARGARQHFEAPGACRYFVAGPRPAVFDVAGVSCALLPAGDGDDAVLREAATHAGARLLLVPDAAPFFDGSIAARQARLAAVAQQAARPLLYANALGAQDGVVFDGAALALDADGALAGTVMRWTGQALELVLQQPAPPAGPALHWQAGAVAPSEQPGHAGPHADPDADLWQALVLGLRDYMGKNGFARAALGLSGGLDSALVLALAVDALGPDNVRALLMPSPYTADISLADAREMARRVGVRLDEIAITPLFEGFKAALAPLFSGRAEDTTEENLQARIRGMLLMALSNKFGHVVLVTSNKSEAAVGYSTLYGDMCGGYAPISDVLKTDAFRLARWRNAHDPLQRGANPIPERIITRPPSAELRAGQRDADSLPPYDVLDAILRGHVERGASAAALVAQGFAAETVARVLHLVRSSEYKRHQAAPGTRVSLRSFDGERRYPLNHQYRA